MNGIVIRKVLVGDFNKIIQMLTQFQEEILADYGLNLNTPNFKEEMFSYVDSSFVAEKNGELVGIIAGKIINFPFSVDKIYQEAIWFVCKEYRSFGLRLMNRLTEWCKEQDIKFLVTSRMINLQSDKLDVVYKHLGFVPYEVNYIKNISQEKEANYALSLSERV